MPKAGKTVKVSKKAKEKIAPKKEKPKPKPKPKAKKRLPGSGGGDAAKEVECYSPVADYLDKAGKTLHGIFSRYDFDSSGSAP